MKQIQELIAATYPPLDHSGSLNLDAIAKYAEFLERDKVDGAFLNGSTGDFASLTLKERKLIVEEWSKCKPKNFKLVVHVGDTCLENAKELAAHAKKFKVDGICTLAPFYFKPTSIEELIQFCKQIAESNPDSPFYYYHIPSLTGVNFDMVRFMELAARQISTFAGLKYSKEDLIEFKSCLDFENGKYQVFFGVDEILLSVLALGATSAVGSTYNHLTPLYHQMIHAFYHGKTEKASLLQTKVMSFVQILSGYGFHSASKLLLSKMGLDLGPVRLPLRNLKKPEIDTLEKEMEQLGILDDLNSLRQTPK